MAQPDRSTQFTVVMLGVTLALIGATAVVAAGTSSRRAASHRVVVTTPAPLAPTVLSGLLYLVGPRDRVVIAGRTVSLPAPA